MVSGRSEYRLGTVPAMSSATFIVPRVVSTPAELSFFASALTSDVLRASETVTVSPGSEVEFSIGQTGVLSNILVRRR